MAINSPVYRVLSSFAGCFHRGEDHEAAYRAFGEAVQRVQQEGEGSVTLMAGSAVVEKFQPRPNRRGTPWLTRLLERRRRRG